MNMKPAKFWLHLVLLLALTLGWTSVAHAIAYSEETVNGVVWGFTIEYGNAFLKYHYNTTGAIGAITFPSRLGGYPVVGIARRAFDGCSDLTSVTIPDSVTRIREEAFYGCRNLTSITIGNGVTSIENNAFENCTALTSVTIGNSVTNIGSFAFRNCSSLTSVTIPDSVTSIAKYAFYACSNLTSVAIGNSVTNIRSSAFYGCSGLTSVTIPDSVTSVGNSAFSGCGLTSVTIGNSVTNIGSSAFLACSNLTSVTIGNGVTSIENNAFENCTALTSVTIGNSVTNIGSFAFRNCSGLTSVTIPDSVTRLGSGAFSNCCTMASVTILGNITNDWYYVSYCPFYNCTNIATLVLDGKMTKIGTNMFYGCSGLTSVAIGNSVTNIGSSAFRDCSSLTSVTIPDSVTRLGSSAFYACSNLTSVTIGNSVTNIGSFAFYGCSGLTSVTIPDSVTSVGNSAFSGCGLTSVTIGNGVRIIGAYSFYRCIALRNVAIGTSVTSIVHAAFSECSSLTHVTIPDSVTSIGDYVFERCSDLTSVTIGNSVTGIGNKAFHDCSSLSNAWFKGGVPTANESSFAGVANGARGYYPAAFSSEWKAAITNGKWCGLIMEEDKAPSCELRVAQADPAAGSLTLAWQETAPVEGVTYSVYRSANDTYSATDLVTNGLTGTSWTDTTYWSAEPVLKPLNYWVVANGGGYGERVSNRVETRHRYGVFVGVGIYEASWFKQLTGKDWFESSSDPPAMRHAELFGRLARENGDFPSEAVSVLTGEKATKDAFHNVLQDVAQKVQTGDYVALFCSTHGHLNWYSHFNGIVMHDTLYSKEELASDLEALAAGKNGLNVVVILNSCYSGGAYSASPKGQNFAWIVTSKESEETGTFSKAMGVPLTHYLLEYGWNRGRAGQGPGTMGTFADLWDYAKSYMSEFRRMGLLDETQGIAQQAVLEHFIVGRLGPAQYASAPETPTVTVAAGENKQTISWTSDSQAEYFALLRKNESNGKRVVGMVSGEVHTQEDGGEKLGISYLPAHLCQYQVAAINEHGISEWSKPEIGTFSSKFWKWLVEKYVDFIIDESTSEETIAAIAASTSANGASYEACYVADIDPNDPDAAFKAKLVRDDGMWKAYPMDGEKEGRVYRVEGKKEMSDESWTDVTDVEDLEAEGWHFFRVGVELAE